MKRKSGEEKTKRTKVRRDHPASFIDYFKLIELIRIDEITAKWRRPLFVPVFAGVESFPISFLLSFYLFVYLFELPRRKKKQEIEKNNHNREEING